MGGAVVDSERTGSCRCEERVWLHADNVKTPPIHHGSFGIDGVLRETEDELNTFMKEFVSKMRAFDPLALVVFARRST